MHARVESELLDDAVDQFEANWGVDAFQKIDAILRGYGLADDANCVVELVRVDIQRRYAAGLEVNLKAYFQSQNRLLWNAELCSLVAYEDYRTRLGKSLPVLQERWEWIPGVKSTIWYKTIEVAATDSRDMSAGNADEAKSPNTSSLTINGKVDSASMSARSKLDSRGCQSHRKAIRLEPADLAQAIDESGFTLVREISVGAFSRVFLVTQDSLANRYVVVKAVLRAFREADRLAQLQHTNIVPIYSYHRSGRWFLICMPYAGLITLADYFASTSESKLRSGQSFVSTIRQAVADDTLRLFDAATAPLVDQSEPIDSDTPNSIKDLFSRLEPLQRDELSLWMFSHLASALSHAHTRNILHGDLKPANILLRNDGEPALLDFNLSSDLDCSEPTSVGGTLCYMAPELMSAMIGSQNRLAATSDIYSLGAVYYQFLTGRLCYTAPRSAAPIDLEFAVSERRKRLQWRADDCVSPGIVSIVTKCLAHDVKDRYQSAEQLREDLERERNLLPLKYAREMSLKHRVRKWFKRHPLVTSVGTLSTLSIAIVTFLSVGLWKISAQRRLLFANATFATFDEQSQHALAGFYIVGHRELEQAVQRGDQCLSQYGVLADSRWQEREEWLYLDESRRQVAEGRLTALLIRTARIQHDHASRLNEAKSAPHRKDAIARTEILSAEPFKSYAPRWIEYLQQLASGDSSGIFASSFPLTEDTASPLDILGQADQAIERLDYDLALRLLTPDLLKSIDPYTYWVTLGRAQLEAGYLPSSVLSFSMAIELVQDAPAAFHYRGVTQLRMRNSEMTQRAIEDFSAALARVGHAYETRINLAMARESLGDLRGAVIELESLSGVPEIDAQALVVRSRIYRKLRNIELAKRDFDAALNIPPRTVDAWQTRALTRLHHDPTGAMEDLLAAAKLSPNSVEVLQNLAHVYSEHLDAPEQAISSLTTLLRLNPTFERALLGRAVLHARLGDRAQAIKDLRFAERSKSRLTPSSVYQAACVHSLVSRDNSESDIQSKSINAALSYLSRAIQMGYGADLLAKDPDLDPLRVDERFQTILEAVALGKTNQR